MLSNVCAATIAPSFGKNYFSLSSGVDESVFLLLQSQVSTVFSAAFTNVDHFVLDIVVAISGPLVSFKDAPSEASVREGSLLPDISKLAEIFS